MSNISTTFNYVVPNPAAIVTQAIFEGTALKYFNKLYNVRNKTELTIVSGVPTLQAVTCDWDPISARTIAPKALEPVLVGIYEKLCKEDAYKLVQSTNDGGLIDNLLGEKLAADLVSRLNKAVDARLFTSATASVTTTGVYTLAKADSNTIKDSSTASITTANVIERYNAFYSLASDDLLASEHITFMPHSDLIKLRQSSLNANQFVPAVISDAATPTEAIYSVSPSNRIVAVNNLSSGQWLMTPQYNLWAGMNDEAVKVMIGQPTQFDNFIKMIAEIMFDAKYAHSGVVVVR
jgi:hypothetical protein